MVAASTRTRATAAGLLAYVRPTFMLPAVGMSVYGAALAPIAVFDPAIAALHAGTVGLALFVAHLRDGYIDGHVRGEETPRLPASTFRWGVRAGVVLVVAASALLFAAGGTIAALSTVSLVALALLHAPYLDRHPATVTIDYPIGIGLTLVGGYAAQTAALAPAVAVVAALFVGLLSGIKVGIDRLDLSFDRSIDKRTLPVVLGAAGASRVAVALFAVTALATVAAGALAAMPALFPMPGALALRPAFAVAAALAPLGSLLATAAAVSPERTVRIQMALTYVFAALLFLSACDDRSAGAVLGAAAIEAAR